MDATASMHSPAGDLEIVLGEEPRRLKQLMQLGKRDPARWARAGNDVPRAALVDQVGPVAAARSRHEIPAQLLVLALGPDPADPDLARQAAPDPACPVQQGYQN